MGYDEDECVSCYAQYGANHCVGYDVHTLVCGVCLYTKITPHESIHGRLVSALSTFHARARIGLCEVCTATKPKVIPTLVIPVPICSRCPYGHRGYDESYDESYDKSSYTGDDDSSNAGDDDAGVGAANDT